MPTYDPLLLLQCDSQEVEPEWRYVAHNISKVFSLGEHLLPVDDKEVVARPHQALHVVLEGQVEHLKALLDGDPVGQLTAEGLLEPVDLEVLGRLQQIRHLIKRIFNAVSFSDDEFVIGPCRSTATHDNDRK